MSKIIKNNTLAVVVIRDMGIEVSLTEPFVIQTTEYPLWRSSADLVTQILNNNIIVNDGFHDIISKRAAIALIQENYPVLNDYYTLTSEDGILIGNGQILQFNDNLYTTDNVPELNDTYEEDN